MHGPGSGRRVVQAPHGPAGSPTRGTAGFPRCGTAAAQRGARRYSRHRRYLRRPTDAHCDGHGMRTAGARGNSAVPRRAAARREARPPNLCRADTPRERAADRCRPLFFSGAIRSCGKRSSRERPKPGGGRAPTSGRGRADGGRRMLVRATEPRRPRGTRLWMFRFRAQAGSLSAVPTAGPGRDRRFPDGHQLPQPGTGPLGNLAVLGLAPFVASAELAGPQPVELVDKDQPLVEAERGHDLTYRPEFLTERLPAARRWAASRRCRAVLLRAWRRALQPARGPSAWKSVRRSRGGDRGSATRSVARAPARGGSVPQSEHPCERGRSAPTSPASSSPRDPPCAAGSGVPATAGPVWRARRALPHGRRRWYRRSDPGAPGGVVVTGYDTTIE